MEHPVLNRIFKVFGLVYSNFDQHSQKYVLSSRLQIYSIFFTIFMQSCNAVAFYCRIQMIPGFFLKSTSMTSRIAIISNWTLWVTLSTTIMLRIITLASSSCKFMNKFYACFSQSGNLERDSIHFLHKLFVGAGIFGTPICVYIFYGFSYLTMALTIAQYCLISQFLAGNFYEWTLFERLNKTVVKLRNDFMLNFDHHGLREQLKRHMDYVDLVKRATKLFQFNKVVGVVGFYVALSFYCFYSYEYITTRSYKKQVNFYSNLQLLVINGELYLYITLGF